MTNMLPPDKLDLPALRTLDRFDLPMPLPASRPRRLSIPPAAYPAWSTLANQRHIRGLARNLSTGELWVATSGGVQCWTSDMQAFTRYGSEHGLMGNAISAIAVDNCGVPWVVYEHNAAISYFDGALWQPYVLLPEVKVTCLLADNAAHLWVASAQGIFVLSKPEQPPLLEISYLGDAPRALAISQSGPQDCLLWLCNARGVFRIKIHQQEMLTCEKWIQYTAQTGIITLTNSDDFLWLGTTDGLACVEIETNRVVKNDLWPSGEVTAIAPAHDGVWIASTSQIGRVTRDAWIPNRQEKTERRSGIRVTGIVPLDDDSAWVGTHDGLLCVTPASIQHYLTEVPPDVIGLAARTSLSNMIQALAIQQYNQEMTVWIGTASGLFRLDIPGERWSCYEQHGLRDIRALEVLSNKTTVAMLSWTGGTYELDIQKALQTLSAESSGPPTAFTFGHDGKWWVAGLYGLYYRQDATSNWSRVAISDELPSGAWIRNLLCVPPAQLWLGTSQGLFIYENDTLQPVLNISGNSDILVLSLLPLPQQDCCCIGTRRGLYMGNILDPRSIRHVPALSFYTITSLLYHTQKSILWVGTTKGLFMLRQQPTGEWIVEDKWNCTNSGLAANRVTTLALSTSQQNEHCLWIGTPCGVSCFTY